MRSHRRWLALVSLLAMAAPLARGGAQRSTAFSTSGVVTIHSPHRITIPEMLGVSAGTVQVARAPGGDCSGPCYETSVNVRANTRWELQVALAAESSDLTVAIAGPDGSGGERRIAPGLYQTIASGPATVGQNVALLITAIDSAAGGPAPTTAARVAGALSYRIVAAR